MITPTHELGTAGSAGTGRGGDVAYLDALNQVGTANPDWEFVPDEETLRGLGREQAAAVIDATLAACQESVRRVQDPWTERVWCMTGRCALGSICALKPGLRLPDRLL